jgi:F-type H+-transporting ATPase subunit alpha
MASTLYAANKGFLDDIPVNQVLHFETGLHHHLKDKCAALLAKMEKDKALDKDAEAELVKAIEAFKKSFV